MNMPEDNKTQVAKNLEWLIAKFNTNPNALSGDTKVPQPTIFRILNSESQDPRTSTLKKLADFFKVSVADMREKDMSAMDKPLTIEDNRNIIEGEVVKTVIEEQPAKSVEESEHVLAIIAIMKELNADWQSKAVAVVQTWLMLANAEYKEQQQKSAGQTGN